LDSPQRGERRQNPIHAAVRNRADWTDTLLLSCPGTAGELHSWCCPCSVFFHLLQSRLVPAVSWGTGHPAAATLGAPDSLGVAWPDDLPQQGVLRQVRKITPAHAAWLSATRQKPKSCTVFSEPPWQWRSCCHAAQETREGESCDPVTIVSLAQIFKI